MKIWKNIWELLLLKCPALVNHEDVDADVGELAENVGKIDPAQEHSQHANLTEKVSSRMHEKEKKPIVWTNFVSFLREILDFLPEGAREAGGE